jgi:hypothetical protein
MDIFEGYPEYDLADLEGDYNPVDWAYYFQYIINFIFIVLPYMMFASICIGYNLWFNIVWNEFWAEGNYWLLLNTMNLILTSFVGLLEFTELPIWLHAGHVIRLLFALFAVLYNFWYFIFVLEWYDMLYIIGDKSDYDFFTVYLNMFLAYNMVMNFP